ncbi:MAG: DUF1585 domain-containing protein [Nannocystales bacterium]
MKTLVMVGTVSVGLLAGGFALMQDAPAQPAADVPLGWQQSHRVQATRLLRRGYMALANRPPTVEEYEELLALPAAEREDAVVERLDALLQGPEFEDAILRFGMELLRVGSYDFRTDFVNSDFDGHYGVEVMACPAGTAHEGALGLLSNSAAYGEPWELCDDPGAPIEEIEPWWEPGSTVTMIGAAGQTDVRSVGGVDCGKPRGRIQWPAPGCSCGPNLVYCNRRDGVGGGENFDNFDPLSMRRSAFEEPGRLFQYIVTNDRPLSDLVVGDYTLVNRPLHYMYLRNGRQNGSNDFLDETEWFRDYASDSHWKETSFESMHPNMLSERDTRFDPRVEDGSPPGVPAAGVLSMLAPNYTFPRERVRGARWLEIFACREFTPPPADVEFHDFQRDPGTEGVCEHCHQLIDPASMHFKRLYGGGAQFGGVGDWSLQALDLDDDYRERSISTFEYDTLMTPVETVRLEENPDAALIDFLPEDYTLFGQTGDGTIGPLGLGKILVESGEFDSCMVRRVHEFVTGRDLVPGRDDTALDAYVDTFVDNDRSVRSLIRAVIRSDDFSIGW